MKTQMPKRKPPKVDVSTQVLLLLAAIFAIAAAVVSTFMVGCGSVTADVEDDAADAGDGVVFDLADPVDEAAEATESPADAVRDLVAVEDAPPEVVLDEAAGHEAEVEAEVEAEAEADADVTEVEDPFDGRVCLDFMGSGPQTVRFVGWATSSCRVVCVSGVDSVEMYGGCAASGCGVTCEMVTGAGVNAVASVDVVGDFWEIEIWCTGGPPPVEVCTPYP